MNMKAWQWRRPRVGKRKGPDRRRIPNTETLELLVRRPGGNNVSGRALLDGELWTLGRGSGWWRGAFHHTPPSSPGPAPPRAPDNAKHLGEQRDNGYSPVQRGHLSYLGVPGYLDPRAGLRESTVIFGRSFFPRLLHLTAHTGVSTLYGSPAISNPIPMPPESYYPQSIIFTAPWPSASTPLN